MAASKPNLKSSHAETELKSIQRDSNIRHHRSQPSSSSTQTGQTTASSSLYPADQIADKDNLPHLLKLTSGNIEHAQSTPSKTALGVFATADSQQSRAVVSSTTTVLRSRFRQKSTSLGLSVLAILLLTFSTWFIYIEFVSKKKPPQLLELSASRTVFTVTALSHANIYLIVPLVEQSLEALRWSLASRSQGVSALSFVSLSGGTGILGLVNLLRVPGRHRFYCSLRYVITTNLFSKFQMIYLTNN
jgi:hypothetical protein